MQKKQDFKKILRDAKLKNTGPRLAILKALSETKHPETAQEIHKRLKKIDLVTLYRTLTAFEKSQLVKRVDMHKDAVYYELNTNHHHHIICTDCGVLEDFKNTEIEKVIAKVARTSPKFKNIKEHSLEIFGICKACA
jgi:Fur family transcriptional regulator, ferric uptake regulator